MGVDDDGKNVYKQLGIVETDKQKYKFFKLIRQKLQNNNNSTNSEIGTFENFCTLLIIANLFNCYLSYNEEKDNTSFFCNYLFIFNENSGKYLDTLITKFL